MNPLYSGEEDPDGMGRDGARRRNEDGGSDGSRSPSYSNPSSSSGYGSNPTTLGRLINSVVFRTFYRVFLTGVDLK